MSLLHEPQAVPSRAVTFHLLADAEPGLLARVVIPFARRDLTPDRLRASREGDCLTVQVAIDEMPADLLDGVEGNLRQIVGVRRVEVAWRASLRAAS
jgi:hypothetical protein